ncbi:MAG: hypothetical protein RL745_975 [Actinomycetota bacterium]
MPLPRAVLEAEETANRLHEELLKQQQNPESDPPPGDPPKEDPPKTDPEPPKPQGDSTPPSATGADDQLEHRYKVLQGKYNSEVPRLAAENRDLKTQLQSLAEQVEALKNAKPPEPLVKPEEIEEYGEGLIDVARRIAREELAAKQNEIDQLKAKIDSLSNVTTQKVETDFFKSLTEMVPDWQEVNKDPKFLTWLDEVDELAGASRQDLLSAAERARDAVRTAKFFTAYKKASSSWAADATKSLDQQVAPATSQHSPTPPSKRVWTRAEIADFYGRVRRGDVSDQEAIAIEADIHAAQIEGRVR